MCACGSKASWLKMSWVVADRPVSHVIPLLVSTSPTHFQFTTTRSTTWPAPPSPRLHWTLITSSRTFSVDRQGLKTEVAKKKKQERRNPAQHLSHTVVAALPPVVFLVTTRRCRQSASLPDWSTCRAHYLGKTLTWCRQAIFEHAGTCWTRELKWTSLNLVNTRR